jgi:hypothetical protein
MGWAVGEHEGRWVGYGVPAICDQPTCSEGIDRGLAYRCGDLTDAGCSRFFCEDHLLGFVEDDEGGGVSVCERCSNDQPPFDPKPDTAEWIRHQLTDPSWEQWRTQNLARAAQLTAALDDEVDPSR